MLLDEIQKAIDNTSDEDALRSQMADMTGKGRRLEAELQAAHARGTAAVEEAAALRRQLQQAVDAQQQDAAQLDAAQQQVWWLREFV